MHIARLLSLAAGLSLAAIGSSAAADLNYGSTKDYGPSGALAQWQGPYMGIVLGAAGTGTEFRHTGNSTPDINGEGFSGGIVAGYNFRSGPWVGGIEADITSAGFSESKTIAGLGTVKASSDVTSSLRLRGGFAWDRVMLYTTAGIAFSDLELQSSAGGKDSGVRAGLALGLGAEVAMDNNWAARLEAIGYGFGIDEEKLGGAKHDVAFGQSQIRLGLSRRF